MPKQTRPDDAADVSNFVEIGPRSRKRPRVGDVFAYRLSGRSYSFGRVIRTDAREFVAVNLLLLYFYRFSSESPELPVRMACTDLLCAPVVTTGSGWARGYFRTIGNVAPRMGDLLKVHCFQSALGAYFDEFDEPLDRRFEPCAIKGIAGIELIGAVLARARGELA